MVDLTATDHLLLKSWQVKLRQLKARLGMPPSASLVNLDLILEALVNFGTFFFPPRMQNDIGMLYEN